MHWACEEINHTACSSNPDSKSPNEMWFGEARPARPYLFLKPRTVRGSDRLSCCRKVKAVFMLDLQEINRVTCHRVLTRAGKIQETRDVTWEAPPSHIPPPHSLLPIEEAGEGGEERDDDVEAAEV